MRDHPLTVAELVEAVLLEGLDPATVPITDPSGNPVRVTWHRTVQSLGGGPYVMVELPEEDR